jgi:hypothetical protein
MIGSDLPDRQAGVGPVTKKVMSLLGDYMAGY